MSEDSNQQLPARAPERPLAHAGFAFLPQTWEQLFAYAKEICRTEFVPKSMRDVPGAVLAAWQTGKEVGLPPMAALQSVAIINGRPSIHSNGYWALITSHPLCEWFTELPPDEALEKGYGECTIKRRGNPHPITRRFSMAEAKTADLIGKDNWKKYPGDMLQNRARHRCGDDAIPEACLGLLPSDVARDLEPIETTVVNPERKEIAAPKPKHPEPKKETANADQHRGGDTSGNPVAVAVQSDVSVPQGDNPVKDSATTEGAKPEEKPAEKKTHSKKDQHKSEVAQGSAGATESAEPEIVTELNKWIAEAPLEELQTEPNKMTQSFAKIPEGSRMKLLKGYDVRRRGEG